MRLVWLHKKGWVCAGAAQPPWRQILSSHPQICPQSLERESVDLFLGAMLVPDRLRGFKDEWIYFSLFQLSHPRDRMARELMRFGGGGVFLMKLEENTEMNLLPLLGHLSLLKD